MKYWRSIILMTCFIMAALCSQSLADVEWGVKRTFDLETAPLDVAVSMKGKRVFVLTDRGEVLIYSADGRLADNIRVGRHVDGIEAGPGEDMLLLTSRKNKTVQYIKLDFIYDIDVSGAPSKGPGDAPVVIAVFADFQ